MPRPSPLSDNIKEILTGSWRLHFQALIAVGLTLFIFFACSYATTFVDRHAIEMQMEKAEANGDFRASFVGPFGHNMPRFGGNDCLILSSLIQSYPDHLDEAISPRIPTPGPLAEAAVGDPVIPACLRLIALLRQPNPTDPNALPYHRYLHGHRVVARVLAAIIPPKMLGVLTAALNVGVLLSVLIPALLRDLIARGAECGRDRGYVAISATLLFFNGLWIYGLYFTHAMSDLVIAAFVAYAYHRHLARATESHFIVAVAVFGVLTAVFEFLTGGIPLGLAILLGIVALDGPSERRSLMRRAVHGSAIFAMAIVISFAVKLAIASLLTKDAVVTDFIWQLSHRVEGSFLAEIGSREIQRVTEYGVDVAVIDRHWLLTLFYMLGKLGYSTFIIGYGSTAVGLAIVGVGFVMTVFLFFRQFRRAAGETTEHRRLALLLASALVMPLWSLVFVNHTLLHAVWMVRPFCWYIGTAGLLAGWGPRNLKMRQSFPGLSTR